MSKGQSPVNKGNKQSGGKFRSTGTTVPDAPKPRKFINPIKIVLDAETENNTKRISEQYLRQYRESYQNEKSFQVTPKRQKEIDESIGSIGLAKRQKEYDKRVLHNLEMDNQKEKQIEAMRATSDFTKLRRLLLSNDKRVRRARISLTTALTAGTTAIVTGVSMASPSSVGESLTLVASGLATNLLFLFPPRFLKKPIWTEDTPPLIGERLEAVRRWGDVETKKKNIIDKRFPVEDNDHFGYIH